jgi:hypothetical protein
MIEKCMLGERRGVKNDRFQKKIGGEIKEYIQHKLIIQNN